MANDSAQLAEPSGRLRHASWLVPLVVLASAALILLWWFDPRQVAVPLCALHQVTGLHCPGCGATRATHELLHGRLLSALQNNALWVLSLPLVLYTVACETRRRIWGRELWGDPLRKPRLIALFVAAAVIFGVLRNVPCVPFTLLAPPG
jgi:hypothetical protein